ncbi:uncharacterized protein TNCV_1896011 [Trichonephila clavipes]|nr:uncharacterized protein TNCV_1896011 [Trichonephila clavipes]
MQMIRISAQTHITRICGVTSKCYFRLGYLDDFKFGSCVFLVLFQKKRSVIYRRKPQRAFHQPSEFDRGRIEAYRDCGLSFREIGSSIGRNQTNVMRLCVRWMQEGTTYRRGRSHLYQCTTSLSACTIRHRLHNSGLSARCPLLGLPLTQNHRRLRHQWCDERRMRAAEWNEAVFNTAMVGFESGDTVERGC